jgi:hypothetical protein
MKFINYYTPKYTEAAMLLQEDAVTFNLDLISDPLEDFRDWQQATRFKAAFIGGYIRNLNDDVCWIDADARIRKNPTLLTELSSANYDIAAVYFKDTELLSGTLWVANTPAANEVVQEWIKYNIDGTKSKPIEQRNLQFAIERNKDCRVLRLPPEYAFIFDLSKSYYPGLEPVIEHMQLSRKIRKQENVDKVLNILVKPLAKEK